MIDLPAGPFGTPSTARDLYDATPRASLSPEPESRDRDLRAQAVPHEAANGQPEDDLVTDVRRFSLANYPRPYDAGSDDLQAEPFFQKDFQRCLKSGRGIANAVYTSLARCSLSTQADPELNHLRDSANTLRSFASPETRLVGIMRDSAAGKSSLINSFLNISDLAHKDIDLRSAEEEYKRISSSREGEKAWEAKMHESRDGTAVYSQLADLKFKYLYIAARIAAVKCAVKKCYAVADISLTITVFCVGNRDYEGANSKSQEARNLAAHNSGVPELRLFCHSIVSRAQYTASMHFLEVGIPSLIESLKQYDIYSIVIALHDRDFNEHALEASKVWTGAPESFLAAFRLKKRELNYLIRKKCSAISEEVQIIETNARGDHISSFVLDLMVATYRERAMQSGTETMARMHKIMKTRLDKRDIFIHIHNRIEDKLQALFDENVDGMLEHITGMCSSIRPGRCVYWSPVRGSEEQSRGGGQGPKPDGRGQSSTVRVAGFTGKVEEGTNSG
ncbi:MAG: hypothetical protein Q9173_005791 [Seirophora scorigena]